MVDWQDNQVSPRIDVFSLGGNSVKLRHDSLFGADITVNRQTCTVTLDQPNGRFSILSGTGIGANKRSIDGRFDLQAMFSFAEVQRGLYGDNSVVPAHHRAVCPLPSSTFAILRALVFNGHGLPQPTFDNVSVQGQALVVSTRPFPHVFAPANTPSDTPTVNPNPDQSASA
jgi:hypothetical protein